MPGGLVSPPDRDPTARDPEAAAPGGALVSADAPATDAPATTAVAPAGVPAPETTAMLAPVSSHDVGPSPADGTAASPASPMASAPVAHDSTVGWFGKLPALGDFASRRLDPQAVQAWDACLSEGLEACRAAWGEAWLDRYLSAPVCCFVQGEDLEDGDPPTAGVLMPSVDRAGRYFPLLLVQPLSALPPGDAAWQALQNHLDRLIEVALGVLQPGQGVEALEAALRTLGDGPDGAASSVKPATGLATPLTPTPKAELPDEATAERTPDTAFQPANARTGSTLLTALLRDHSLWWHGAPGAAVWTRLDSRWPTPATFTAWLAAV